MKKIALKQSKNRMKTSEKMILSVDSISVDISFKSGMIKAP
jgi:hypothetical protein